MTPFHPELRKALLKDSKKSKNKVFKITESSLRKLNIDDFLNTPLADKIKDFAKKDQEIVGQKKFLKAVKKEIGDKRIYKDQKKNILKYSTITDLTERNLLDYEGWIAQFYYHYQYAKPEKAADLLRIFKQIQDFRMRNLSNFDKVRDKWQKRQHKALMRRNFHLSFDFFGRLTIILLSLWLLAAIIYRVIH